MYFSDPHPTIVSFCNKVSFFCKSLSHEVPDDDLKTSANVVHFDISAIVLVDLQISSNHIVKMAHITFI